MTKQEIAEILHIPQTFGTPPSNHLWYEEHEENGETKAKVKFFGQYLEVHESNPEGVRKEILKNLIRIIAEEKIQA